MVQNLRAYFILYVITIKYIKCMQEKRSNFLVSTKTKVDLSQNFRRSLIGYNDKATIKNCRKILRGDKRTASRCPGMAFATLCHPMATGLN